MAIVVKTKKRKLGSSSGSSGSSREQSPLRPYPTPKDSPCHAGCPNHGAIRTALRIIADSEKFGRTYEASFELAWQAITENNPLPAILGRVCPHLCEDDCNRKTLDGAVNVNSIERFLGDFGIAQKLSLSRVATRPEKIQIAVIGSGPAGLSCAYQLARRGVAVTIFESLPKPGGMLRYGIPTYRLPKNILDAEIQRILDLGVEIKCNSAIGRDISYEELRQEYRAVFIGIGAQRATNLGIAGEKTEGVIGGIEFLRQVASGEKCQVGKQVVVIGGGNTAIDAARTSLRLGASDVTILYRRTREEMPAHHDEIEETLEEGIKISYLAAPIAIERRSDRLTLKCIRMELGEPDQSGRKYPRPVPGSEYEIAADTIIPAIGQEIDVSGLESLIVDKKSRPIDDYGQMIAGVHAGGDMLGLGLVSQAISQGRMAAEAMIAQIDGQDIKVQEKAPVVLYEKMRLDHYEKVARQDRPRVAPTVRLAQADHEVSIGLSREEVIQEAKRCLSCGYCFDCEKCWMYCQVSAVAKPAHKGEPYGYKLELCDGCKKCAEECPCGFIEMR